ncbi:LOW QUALITY PROTEIN: Hypothetical protein PHPALM_159 [Phytophthora palmivora]|uniref:Uncharacterized protein n=1 Tax=Phytophthora palmivora TaxID=4796 RepID=A0A2P4YVK3_9STRA|nr:LOW QUALITY PROTEIN: Hypothetical protein PHPALM_159 [Phytophthora palmivora]
MSVARGTLAFIGPVQTRKLISIVEVVSVSDESVNVVVVGQTRSSLRICSTFQQMWLRSVLFPTLSGTCGQDHIWHILLHLFAPQKKGSTCGLMGGFRLYLICHYQHPPRDQL